MMASNSMEWVEIIEPKTGEHMYANLTTGECVWDPPEGVPVKRTDSNQWWELFDSNTARFYYYNASTQCTVWHRPNNCDIIPLAKLQTLKQNTDPESKTTIQQQQSNNTIIQPTQVHQSTQTPTIKASKKDQIYGSSRHRNQEQQSHHSHSQQQQAVPLSLSASTPQLRRRTSELSRSSSFVTSQSQQQRSRDRDKQTNTTTPPSSIITNSTTSTTITPPSTCSSDLINNYENSCIPLYSNWHETTEQYLLPLQHYILQQNSLLGGREADGRSLSGLGAISGCYRTGDHIDSDTGSDDGHSYSGSESLTGHEPDNEDSDQSETNSYHHHIPPPLCTPSAEGRGPGALGSSIQQLSSPSMYNKQQQQQPQYSNTKLSGEYLNHPSFSLNNRSDHHHRDRGDDKDKQVTSTTDSKYLTYGFRNNYTSTSSSLPQSTPSQVPTSFNSCPRMIDQSNQSSSTSITPGSGGGPGGPGGSLWLHEQENYYSIAEAQQSTSIQLPEIDMEKFAQDNLNLHSKGIFRRKQTVRDMLSWSGGSINRAMLSIACNDGGKQHNKMCRDLFRLIQVYMGDRKTRVQGISCNSVLHDILTIAFNNVNIRDELYLQLCRQTTENPRRDSLLRGWELFAVALSFIPPSVTFQPVLHGYLNRHYDPSLTRIFPDPERGPIHVRISHYAMIAINRLERIGHQTGKRKARKPQPDDIDAARIQIFKTSMFGNTLQEVMNLQRDKYPDRQLPWAQVVLSEQILRLDGASTEGIFRVSADVDEVNTYKNKLDQWELIDAPSDAHVPANLLKLWYRELYEPLIPDTLYDECVYEPMTIERATNIIQRLPRINRFVLCYLIRFLQTFSQPAVVSKTKMDASNLAMVFAPNCLRCTATDPRVIFENARKEMAFMRCLIEGLDTICVKDLV
ncbi:rho GTPase-activating protein 39 isoform X1 [Chrysoperla carnea]|uniref:rho GTPase-activating protein 39 isoform X1 n=1 Tax=Chrysoperla carnea TaxID=189513 RepID=UPI001D08A8DA|nr:rho GTPase-activating protein 39 isoform X1 [Chrysoperla carnea]